MRIERVQRASAQFENVNIRLGPALDPKPCSLANWTHSIRIQQDGTWKGIGGVITEMIVSVLLSRRLDNDDCKYLMRLALYLISDLNKLCFFSRSMAL